MKKPKFGVLLIGVTDLNKARPFYEKVFGVETVEFRPPFMQGKLGDIELNIEENADYRRSDWAEQHIGGRKSFTFQVEDIFEFVENAKKFGARIIENPVRQEWGWSDAIVADPDGNEFIMEQEDVGA